MNTLSEQEVREGLKDRPGWSLEGARIVKEYRFGSFMEAIGFINRVAERAEAADHHPDLENTYDRVRVGLSTHSAGGVTQKDLDLAGEIEECSGAS